MSAHNICFYGKQEKSVPDIYQIRLNKSYEK